MRREGQVKRRRKQEKKDRKRKPRVGEERVRPRKPRPRGGKHAVGRDVPRRNDGRGKHARRLRKERAAPQSLRNEHGRTEAFFQQAEIELAAPRVKPLRLGKRQRRAPTLCQRKKQGQTAFHRAALAHEEHGRGRVRRKIAARALFLHAHALRRVDPGEVDERDAPSAERRLLFERAHRHAVPIPHLGVSARERVEERALPRVGIADEKHLHAVTSTLSAISAPSAKVENAVSTSQTRLRGETRSTETSAPQNSPSARSRAPSASEVCTPATRARSPCLQSFNVIPRISPWHKKCGKESVYSPFRVPNALISPFTTV